jgi:hypothetical protein
MTVDFVQCLVHAYNYVQDVQEIARWLESFFVRLT